jgi:hypothetical protein
MKERPTGLRGGAADIADIFCKKQDKKALDKGEVVL